MNKLFFGNTLEHYHEFDPPTVIISDGPYGIDGYSGDAKTHKSLASMYQPHIEAWNKKITSQTTLWFWNTEVGWASVHPILEQNGWIYRGLNIWDKGIKHIAGNCNGKTMRKFPTVTEVCAHYVRKEEFQINNKTFSLQQWLRDEWKRTGLAFSKANEACGVKNAASRKYLAADHLWYFPPSEEFKKMVQYANKHGEEQGKPYFSLDGKASLTSSQWNQIRAKFNFEYGVTNVWQVPPLKTKERLKDGTVIFHPNQKPLELMNRLISASSDKNDVIWEPFGGTGSACLAAKQLGRKFNYCEEKQEYFEMAEKRLK
jgi:DNA methylase